MGKKEFAAAALDPEHETYVVHVGSVSSIASPSSSPLDVHPSRRPQIAGLIAEEARTKVPVKYADFADIFSPDLASELPEHTGINEHAIKLVDDHPSHSQVLPSFLTGSQTVLSGSASIIEASITSRSRNSTRCRWLGSRWTG